MRKRFVKLLLFKVDTQYRLLYGFSSETEQSSYLWKAFPADKKGQKLIVKAILSPSEADNFSINLTGTEPIMLCERVTLKSPQLYKREQLLYSDDEEQQTVPISEFCYFYQTPLLRIAAGTASPFITSRPMTTVKAAFFSLSTTIQMIATSEIRISVSKYWILSIINQALSKTKEFPEIESRYFASEEEFRSLLASRQFIKAVILTDVCRYRFYAIPKLCIIAEFFTLHIPLALCPV